ncbi:MAG: bifunctional sulfate adenylyltransferase/adenylylsulfate kinase [Gammaproteobacteria bacterium]|nr:bifunctional sulfate adenylyltransferase/adenylylsulfate kinase [Gammaproteobacteria bacterium]
MVTGERAEQLKEASLSFKSVTLSKRQLCDLELLLNGGFTPLKGFLGQQDYDSVLENTRLSNGTLWPIPITLDVSSEFAESLNPGEQIALRDPEGFMPAVLRVEEKWEPDKAREAELVYGTHDDRHPGVRYLNEEVKGTYISGRLEGIQLPLHYDFETLWDTPNEMRRLFDKMGWRRVLSFHTSNPMHRMQREMILAMAKETEAHILLHPAVGVTKPGDLHYYARVHCYKAIQAHFPHNLAALSLLPLAMRMAGPREALWHAIVNQNYGCTNFIVGPDHASPPHPASTGGSRDTLSHDTPVSGNQKSSYNFYSRFQAQEMAQEFADDLQIEILPVPQWRYAPDRKRFYPLPTIEKQGLEAESYNNSDLKRAFERDQDIPGWFSYPSVIDELRKVYPSRSRQGFTLFFTGLSGSGKSTVAGILYAKLIESGNRPVSLLDGDIVRQNLSSELGFSKAHRDLNIRRIGFVASEITKNGGVAICAPIAPYRETRRAVRELIEQQGAFIEIHVATPLDVCEGRDRKGLYAKARKGIIPEFTGISDPYNVPEHPELSIDTSELSPAQAAQEVLLFLFKEGYIDEN